MMEFLADSAALFASFCFAFGGYFFSDAVKKIGSYSVNAVRILIYLVGILLVYFILFGFGIPEAPPAQWLFLGLSAFTGLVFGDYLFFVTLKHISPRLTFLISAPLAPIFSALIGLLFLGEKLVIKDIIGIVVVLSGLLIVLCKKNAEDQPPDGGGGKKSFGVIIAFICSFGYGISMVFTKIGVTGGASGTAKPLDPFTASVIRIFFGCIIIWGMVFLSGKTKQVTESMRNKFGLNMVIFGALFALTGIWMLLFALSHTKVGIAATLGGMMPVMIIPIMYIMKKERTGARGIIGSVVSIAGVAVLMLG